MDPIDREPATSKAADDLFLGWIGSSGGQGTTVSNVAVQPADLPSGMVRCNLSGNIEDFIKSEQSPDPNTSKSVSGYWQDAQKSGAKAAYAAIYTDSQARCAAIKDPSTDVGTATYKLVVNFVVQFKDEKTAADAYTNKSIFGFSPSQSWGRFFGLRASRWPTCQGRGVQLRPRALLPSRHEPIRSLVRRIRESCSRRSGAPHVLQRRLAGTYMPFRAQVPYWLAFEVQSRQ